MSLIDGLKNAGFNIDNSLKSSYEAYIPEATAKMPKSTSQFAAFLPKHLIPEMDLSNVNMQKVAKDNDVAIITIGKTSGEFADRYISDNFNLTAAEKKMISDVCTSFHKAGKKVVVILNVCGVVETKSWIDAPDAVITAWLPGQEGGNSVSDILIEMITMTIPYESLASFNETASQWQVEGGQYTVMVAKNAADMKPLTSTVNIEGKVTEAVRPSLLPEQK